MNPQLTNWHSSLFSCKPRFLFQQTVFTYWEKAKVIINILYTLVKHIKTWPWRTYLKIGSAPYSYALACIVNSFALILVYYLMFLFTFVYIQILKGSLTIGKILHHKYRFPRVTFCWGLFIVVAFFQRWSVWVLLFSQQWWWDRHHLL